MSPRVGGDGGRREVPPAWILGGAEASLEEEGGGGEKCFSPHATEPEASEART